MCCFLLNSSLLYRWQRGTHQERLPAALPRQEAAAPLHPQGVHHRCHVQNPAPAPEGLCDRAILLSRRLNRWPLSHHHAGALHSAQAECGQAPAHQGPLCEGVGDGAARHVLSGRSLCRWHASHQDAARLPAGQVDGEKRQKKQYLVGSRKDSRQALTEGAPAPP